MGVVNRKNRNEVPERRPVSAIARELSESLEESFEQGDTTFDEYGDDDALPTDEDVESSLAPYDFDIFVDYGDKYSQKGDLPKYHIYKNNQLLSVKLHPYSWDRLQKEFGGGHYKIRMSSSTSGKFIKQQSQHVADVPRSELDEENKQTNNKFFDLLATMNQTIQENQMRQEERSREERLAFERKMEQQNSKLAEESQNQQNTLLAMITAMMNRPKDNSTETIMAAMQQQSQQNMQMMMAMMEGGKKNDNSEAIMTLMMQMNTNTMNLIKEMNQSTSSAFEKIGDKIANMQNKDDGLGGLKLVELFQTAQGQGFEQMKMLQELADAKADEKAALSGNEDDSTVKTLIKSVVPIVGQLAQVAQNNRENPALSYQGHAPTQNPSARAERPQGAPKTAPQRPANQGSVNGNRQGGQRAGGLPRPKVAKSPEVVKKSNSDKYEWTKRKSFRNAHSFYRRVLSSC
jgi:hypothetical protein